MVGKFPKNALETVGKIPEITTKMVGKFLIFI